VVVTGPYLPREEIKTTGAAYGATFVAHAAEQELGEDDRKMARSLGRRVAEVAGVLAAGGAAQEKEGTPAEAA